ncbi:hypothetical protein [Rickettsia tamurae]|uniref:hypothetical protein n=1 Tax=Rickettsia tamurae TaxID=334545 RepID=UPI001BFD0AB8|nr:hypothetical protein [Rickettsia tamurae]
MLNLKSCSMSSLRAIVAWIPSRHCERTLVSVAISGILSKIASSIYYCKFSRNDGK